MWNYIYITWEYEVNNIWEELKELFYYYKEIKFSIDNITQNIYNSNIDILYNKDSKVIIFETTYNNKKLIIKILDKLIISTKYDWNELLDNKINYKLLPTILNNITKSKWQKEINE